MFNLKNTQVELIIILLEIQFIKTRLYLVQNLFFFPRKCNHYLYLNVLMHIDVHYIYIIFSGLRTNRNSSNQYAVQVHHNIINWCTVVPTDKRGLNI